MKQGEKEGYVQYLASDALKMSDAMNDLITRLEMAPDGSEELDQEVEDIIGHDFYGDPTYGSYWWTRNVADALSLIDSNFGVTFHRYLGMKGRSWATVFSNYPEDTPRPVGTIARPEWTCAANTEALAVCAAALKSLNLTVGETK